MSQSAPSEPAPSTRKSRWPLWLLLISIGVGVGIIVVLNIWNARQQLTKEKLEAARQRWDSSNTQDYDVDVLVTGRTNSTYHVAVRKGQITTALMNGKPFQNAQGQLDIRHAYFWTIPGLFEVLSTELANAAKPDAPPCYSQVEFNPVDGHPQRFLRSSSGGTILIEVHLQRINQP